MTFFRPKSVGPFDLALSEIKGARDRCDTAGSKYVSSVTNPDAR